MHYSPRVYQDLIIRFGLARERGNIFSGMGTGKTSASIMLYNTLRAFGESRRALILAPKRVAKSTWPDEITKWHETFGHLRIGAAIGTADQRKKVVMSEPDILTINYENIEWLIDGYGEHWPFDVVFADECTRLKSLRVTERVSVKDNKYIQGQGGTRARALADVAFKRVRRWYNLTGSPAPNGLQDLWGINWFVDGGYRLGRSFGGFQDAFFRSYTNEDGYSKLEPHAWAEPQIQALMRDCCITIDAKDYFDIKAPIESNVYVDLPPKARSTYERMEKEFFAEIQTKGLDVAAILAFNGSSKSTKLLQLAHGAVWHGEGVEKDWDEVHSEKLDALSSVLEEANGESVLVRYTYRPDLYRILKAFGKGRKPVKYLDENPQTIKDWNAGRIHLVTHAKSAGHGLNLQDGGRIMCDFASDFNLEEDEQILERIGPTRQLQSGHDRAVFRRRIVARDTIEEMSVLPVIQRKMTVQESFKNAMKVRNST